MARTRDPIDDYIAAAAAEAQPILRRIRAAVREAVPDAVETISYRMPALKVRKVFFYFAAFKKHIGVYPPVTENEALVSEVTRFRGPKGNLSFPHGQELPLELIGRVAVALAAQYAQR